MEEKKAAAFNTAFVERRLKEHKRWLYEVEHALTEEIIDEVQELPKRQPKSGRLFFELPEAMKG